MKLRALFLGLALTLFSTGAFAFCVGEPPANYFCGSPEDLSGEIKPRPIEYFISLTANFVLTDTATAQKAFNTPTNGAITLPASSAYFFSLNYLITNTGVTSHTWAVVFAGTATLTSGAMQCNAVSATSAAMTASLQGYTTTLATPYVVTAASTSATENVSIFCRGRVNINAAGTFIPQIKMSAAAVGTETMLAGSHFRMFPMGANTVTSAGNWN